MSPDKLKLYTELMEDRKPHLNDSYREFWSDLDQATKRPNKLTHQWEETTLLLAVLKRTLWARSAYYGGIMFHRLFNLVDRVYLRFHWVSPCCKAGVYKWGAGKDYCETCGQRIHWEEV